MKTATPYEFATDSFCAGGSSPRGGREGVKKEVLKFQQEDERVREKCEALRCPKAMLQRFLSLEVEAGGGDGSSAVLTTLEPCFVHARVRGGFPVHAHVKAASMPMSTVMGLGSDSSRGPTETTRAAGQNQLTGAELQQPIDFLHDLVQFQILT